MLRYGQRQPHEFQGVYCTTYCNRAHRLSDGKPVEHECKVIPPLALLAERDGDFETAVAIMDLASRHGVMRVHRGVKA